MTGMMPSTSLPLPEVVELPEIPPEFARGVDALAAALKQRSRKLRRSPSATPVDRVEVRYLEDPRASIFALFS